MTYAGNRGDCSDIWGYVDEFGNEYAIVGNQTGTSIVDVTDPVNPVEVFYSAGANTIWRDMKVWGDFAYIVNEGGNGMKIIDLSALPGALNGGDVSQFTGSTYPFSTAHNIFIDEVGRAYIVGANNGAGGAIILDVATTPGSPIELGRYNDYYMHDVFVRGDTLWGGAINDGFFTVVDVSDPANTVTMASHNTPSTFSHNVWLSDDGNTLFTTDEVSNAYVAAYDVSDITSISEIDRIQSSPGNNVIPHNSFVKGNFVITSYYRDGVVVHDATNPSNLIEVGNYDTSPQFSGNGFNGCWGVYPYFPSGNLVASDIENGLFVLGANYVQGCYLDGLVTDAATTNPINNALIEIVATSVTDNSDASGNYLTGIATAGTYDVTFSKTGYFPQTITGVTLSSGVTTTLDVQLIPLASFTMTGMVVDTNGVGIPNAQVFVGNSQVPNLVTTNGLGEFDIPSFLQDTYDVTIGLWGYHTLCLSGQFIDSLSNPYTYTLVPGYSDIFELDLGWTVTGNPASGDWERDEPIGTDYFGVSCNPDFDSQDCGDKAYITGNGGGQAGTDDIDDGETVLTSPVFDLSNYNDAYLSFERWFFNEGGQGTPNDSLVVELSNGSQTVMIDFADNDDPDEATWAFKEVRVVDYLTATAFMQIRVRAMDQPGGHLAEGGFDNFYIRDSLYEIVDTVIDTSFIKEIDLAYFNVYPVPFTNEINVKVEGNHGNLVVMLFEIGSGKLVQRESFETNEGFIPTSDISSGMYIVKVYSEDLLLGTRKVFKQ